MAGSPISKLPRELLAQCIETTLDPVYQWCTCRSVSHEFREATDLVFEKTVLAETWIDFDLDWEYLDEENQTDKCMFDVQCKFFGFADAEKKIAVFKEDLPVPEDEEQRQRFERIQRMLKEKWMDNVCSYWKERILADVSDQVTLYSGENEHAQGPEDGRYDLPPWMITVISAVNDTELPGFNTDYDKHEISFRWKEAFQCFFREEKFISEALVQYVSLIDH